MRVPPSIQFALIACLLSAVCGGGCVLAAEPTAGPAYPLHASSNGHYLVDQRGTPFLMIGDSPQGLMVNVSEADADMFFANRAKYGFNTLWICLLCGPYTGGRADDSTYDGIVPFTKKGDFATPNEAYFARCDRMVALAAKHGLLVILDPCETGEFLPLMRSNGVEKCRAFGRYVGRRYAKFDNIVWMSGNDFGTWRDPRNDPVVLAVAEGIREVDRRHMQTVEFNAPVCLSTDDPKWARFVDLNAAYTYMLTYADVIDGYNRTPAMPVFMVEAVYEYAHDSKPVTLRRQEYWSLLSGATGELYGNLHTWPLESGWKKYLDTPGSIQTLYLRDFFAQLPWWRLVPDQDHTVVTAGYGIFDSSQTAATQYVSNSDYVTTARTPDGSLVVAYLPMSGSITVDMAKLRGPVTARWFDPSRGSYMRIADRPLPNHGARVFTSPGPNGDGDWDWVLILQAPAR